jgi:GGDEF domain-containing protein
MRLQVRSDLQVQVHFSLGIAYRQNASDRMTLDDLLSQADAAMYTGKRHGAHGPVIAAPTAL